MASHLRSQNLIAALEQELRSSVLSTLSSTKPKNVFSYICSLKMIFFFHSLWPTKVSKIYYYHAPHPNEILTSTKIARILYLEK